MHIGVITNPNSRKNKGRPGRAAELQSIVGELGEVHETSDVESIKPVLREFLRKRARYWVADGGDGALHWMLRTGMEVLEEEEFAGQNISLPMTMPTNGGTIDFVATNVGIRGTAENLLANLRSSIESGGTIEEIEVDSMLIDGIELDAGGERRAFRTFGFAVAAGGIGQRFFSKYYAEQDPNPRTIMKVVGNTIASMPVALSPLRAVPGMAGMGAYAEHMFKPTPCRVTMDGMILEGEAFTGVHVASMSINLGNVFRLFSKADAPGLLHALVGSPSPLSVLRNLPRMAMGRELRGRKLIDRACRELTMEATGDELLEPIIDGEYYRNIERISFQLGPRVRIPKLVARSRRN